MAVLLHGPGQHGEVHLPLVIDSHYPDDRLGLAVPGDQHRPGADAGGIAGLAQRGPAESVIVFIVRSAIRSIREFRFAHARRPANLCLAGPQLMTGWAGFRLVL